MSGHGVRPVAAGGGWWLAAGHYQPRPRSALISLVASNPSEKAPFLNTLIPLLTRTTLLRQLHDQRHAADEETRCDPLDKIKLKSVGDSKY